MGLLSYFKKRAKQIVGGFCFGVLIGYGRSYAFGPADLPDSARLILALQIGLAFSALALFITNYLELRQRVIAKAKSESDKNSAAGGSS